MSSREKRKRRKVSTRGEGASMQKRTGPINNKWIKAKGGLIRREGSHKSKEENSTKNDAISNLYIRRIGAEVVPNQMG